ncbi:ATP synthase subunit I [Marimonas lutisalis]|uniref:ATP synthase subunit I n=1 Tax=Marimonas lutisalis TaxID=2545756 RepID=UPI0010F66BD8|nr:ATP synthase subunit I [Marimonas lutisalis]
MSIIQSQIPWFVCGLALGGVYLFLIHLSVQAIMRETGWIAAFGPLALRVGLAGVAFYFAAQSGALSVIVMLAGFLLMRSMAVRKMREG